MKTKYTPEKNIVLGSKKRHKKDHFSTAHRSLLSVSLPTKKEEVKTQQTQNKHKTNNTNTKENENMNDRCCVKDEEE